MASDFSLRAYVSQGIKPLDTFPKTQKGKGKAVVRFEAKMGENLIFDHAVKAKVVQSQQEIKQLMSSKKWVPISLKKLDTKKDAESLNPNEIVFVKIINLAKLNFISIQKITRPIKSDQEFSLTALQVRAMLDLDQQIEAESVQMINSAIRKLSAPISNHLLVTANNLLNKVKGMSINEEQRKGLLEQRTEGSNTIKVDSQKQNDWLKAEEFVRKKSEKKDNLTLQDMLKLNALISGDDAAELKAGEWRNHTIALGGFGGPQYLGHSQEQVKELMTQFSEWLDLGIKKCEKGIENPIILAAQAYQRMVSIHPFPEGNGRTARLVMDYVLMRFDIPPASLGSDVSVAVFGDQLADISEISATPTLAVEKIMAGIDNSVNIIKKLS